MRMMLRAAADGKAAVPYPVTVVSEGFAVSLYGGDDGMIDRIEVSRSVAETELPSFTPTPGGEVAAEIQLPSSETEGELISLLQFIESLGAFWLGIRKIDWEEAERKWIPESHEERSRTTVLGHKIRSSFPETPQLFRPRILHDLIQSRERLAYLVIPMAFMREGINEYRRFRFVSAFYQFYFYLEDLYGQGKWRSKAVKDNFLASPQVVEAAEAAVEFFEAEGRKRDRIDLLRLLDEHGLDFTASGLVELIVEMRGNLHHFSQKSSRTHGHPLNQPDFKALALLLLNMCLSTYPLITRDGKPI